ncbi:hypothetical protein M0R45_019639 [Rubus argutus]|uniref:Cytochrome P450 n=1 Tax=Rubus argutus TaxID=59490 RepID=A0AAW1X9L9_RUBAR
MMNWMRDTVLTLPSFLQIHGFSGNSGPSYRLIHGNNKEISNMLKEAMSKPIRNLSHDVLSAVQPHIHSWTKTYGKNFLQWYGLQPVLVITEPELCKEILNNKDRLYSKKKPNVYGKKLFGDSISIAEGEKWSKLRKLSNHAFHGDSLKSMIPDMIASSEAMLEGWKKHEGKEIEVYEQFRLFTSEVISRTAFGSCYLEGKNIFDMLMKLSSVIFRNSYKLRIPGISKVYKPTLHPDWQEKARNEVLQLFGKETRNPDGLAKLKTMSMIINESLRLYPPVIVLRRKVDMEVRLGNLIVPANVELLVPNLALHHEPQIWGQDVKLFKPERFSDGVANATNNNMAAFLPFGMGPRTCVGLNFATIEAKIALSMILQRYAFTLSPAYVHSPFQFLTVRPQHGLQVILNSL